MEADFDSIQAQQNLRGDQRDEAGVESKRDEACMYTYILMAASRILLGYFVRKCSWENERNSSNLHDPTNVAWGNETTV